MISCLVFDRNGIFAESPKYISVKIGFSAEIIRFRPKLFGFRCFGRLVSVPKEPKSAESAEMPKLKHYSVKHYNKVSNILNFGGIIAIHPLSTTAR